MRTILRISVLTLTILFFYSCKKDKPTIPTITTRAVSDISTTSAVSGGDVTNEGGAALISKGICWNISPDPTLDHNKTSESGGSVSFSSNISQLSPNTTYYVRAYAINTAGTGYGKSVSFKTLGDKPEPNSANASDIQVNSATLNGTVNPNSLSTVVTFEYGTTTSYGSTITAAQSPITGNTAANISADLTGLIPGTVYHFRIKAENSLGTTFSSDLTLTTLGQAPTVIAQPATGLQLSTATVNGTVNPNLVSTVASFEWGLTTSYGSTVTAIQSPVTGSSIVNISANLSRLAPGTTYHFRIKGENSVGITYSNDLTFITLGQVPAALTQAATNLQITSSTLNGSVNANYLSTTAVFEWGTTTSYGSTATALQSPITGNTVQVISANLPGLTPGTTYHFRIKAENLLGITYSNDLTFTTPGQIPSVTLLPVSNLQIYTATLNGSVNANYLSTSAVFEWGPTTSYGNTAVALQSPVDGNTVTSISSNLPGLTPGTTYHFRIKAENVLGITYSDDVTFTTPGQVPSATSQVATGIQINSATINGSVNANYLSTTTSFEWGTTTIYGSTTIPSQNPVTGNSATNISANITGLTPGTTYHFRIKAINELGTTYSNDLTFITLGQIPTAIPLDPTNLQINRAKINGSVNANYLTTTASFEWGTTTSYGSTVAAMQNPITGNEALNISADLSGLTPGTTYHFRIKATNELGTSYSNDLTFITLTPISDIDGNIYGIMTLGTQVWMTENLKTTRYNNGDPIGTTSPALLDISGETTPKYQWAYDGNETNVANYGRLYTWYAATDIRNVCPAGWHLPTDGDWTALTNYLINNGYGYEGSGTDIGKSMSATALWNTDSTPGNVGNDIASNNKSGFSAVPGGYRTEYGGGRDFSLLGYQCFWWSATRFSPDTNIAWQWSLWYRSSELTKNYSGGMNTGISVRCLKN